VKPRLLDLFCCQGGASAGYAAAGFEVTGVDIEPQPRYPYEFHQADAIQFLSRYGCGFDVIAGSPPCQKWTRAQTIRGNEHPDFIEPMREHVQALGKPYVIENVVGAPLLDPVMLCGSMFALGTYRHRIFESSVPLATRLHPRHVAPIADMGRPIRPGERYHAVGNFTGAAKVAEDLGVQWMSRDGIRECIPPAYTRFLGEQLIRHLAVSEVAP
jgi:DNA (cytosine-5)-methyltransferase 1